MSSQTPNAFWDFLLEILAGKLKTGSSEQLFAEFLFGTLNTFLKGFLVWFALRLWYFWWPSKTIWGQHFRLTDILLGRGIEAPVVVLASRPGVKIKGYEYLATDIGQVRSVANLSPSLEGAFSLKGKKLSVVFSGHHGDSTSAKEVITVGGRKFNEVSKSFLWRNRKTLNQGFTLDNVPSVDAVDGTVDVPLWDGKHYFSGQKFAFGMIIRLKNDTTGKFTTLVAGAGTYGTEAASDVLANSKEMRRWLRWRCWNNEFVALVFSELNQGGTHNAVTAGTKLVGIRKITDKKVSPVKWRFEEVRLAEISDLVDSHDDETKSPRRHIGVKSTATRPNRKR
jgi:hypothetical protein